jgi:pimeloyl-ACP methyl ester carboxylesterase
LNAQELEALVETIVAQSMPTPRARKRLATILDNTPARRIPTGDGAVTAWRLGEGPALLLAHGAFDDHILWAPMMTAAAARGRSVIVLDMPGYGHSAEADRGPDGGAAAIQAVAEALGPVHTVMGHSIGAVAAIRALWSGLPACKAVLFAPALPTRWDLWVLERTIIAPEDAPAIAVARARERLQAPPVGPQFDFDVEGAVRGLTIPALLAHSRDDPHWSWRTAEILSAQWPGARAHYADGLGHRDIARDPDVIRAVLDFVDQAA